MCCIFKISGLSRRPQNSIIASSLANMETYQPGPVESLSLSAPKPASDPPVFANFDCSHLTIGSGVAIFHLATSRVVLCWHSTDNYWFLPKGRRDADEVTGCGAEREGFEEVFLLFQIP